MADWNAALYLRFADERTRPARELLARVPEGAVAHAVDLGCGPGNSTELLTERFPGAAVLGLDTSPDMLGTARGRLPAARFEIGDIAAFRAERPVDLLFANAALQWVPDHESLLPALLGELAPGGTLAVQMPDNLEEPSHRLMREVAADLRFAAAIGDAAALRTRILSTNAYYDILAPRSRSVDIWLTTYHHVMAGPDAIVEWLRATGLKVFLDPLDEAGRRDFVEAYTDRVARAYPPRADGKLLFPFPRLFLVASV
jgi:trans-aconitate 2-methyltransferase